MLRGHDHRRCERRIARWFTVGLHGKEMSKLFEQLERCPTCADLYARYQELEGALFHTPHPSSPGAVDRVANAIFTHPRRLREPRRSPWPRLAGAFVGVLLCAILIVSILRGGPSPHRVSLSDADPALAEVMPRGASRAGVSYVGIRAFTVTSEGVGFKDTRGVGIDNILTFTYTYTKGARGYLMMLGLQEETEPLWYYPDYGEEMSIPIRGDRVDEPLGDGIDLSVNHRPGLLRVVSLFSTAPIHRDRVLESVERLRRSGWLLDETSKLALDDSGIEAVEYSIVFRIGGSNDGDE